MINGVTRATKDRNSHWDSGHPIIRHKKIDLHQQTQETDGERLDQDEQVKMHYIFNNNFIVIDTYYSYLQYMDFNSYGDNIS